MKNKARLGGQIENEVLGRVAVLLGFVDEAIRTRVKHRYFTECEGYDRAVFVLREVFGDDRFAGLAALGASWSEENAIAEALELL